MVNLFILDSKVLVHEITSLELNQILWKLLEINEVKNVKKKIESISGVLVEAMRKGHWIILDELNLAPTDVLEALNRVMSTKLQSAYRSKRPSTG